MSATNISLILLICCSLRAAGQIAGETPDHLNFGQIFSRVDSDLNGNLFKDFVDFSGGDLLEYDDLMTSETALTEQQLTERQTKLRELYRGRRPVGGNKVNPRLSFFNRMKGKKKTEEKRDPIKEKILDKFQSGMAVTVVKPPPDYQPPASTEQKIETESKTDMKKEREVKEKEVKEKTRKNPLKDWRGKQKQREAAATSLIGSRLKDLKEKRKQFMNTNLVTEHNVDIVRPDERIDGDSQSLELKSGEQLVKVQIEEKSSENHFKFPSKKRRFKPQIKPAAAPPKWTIKEKIKNKHKHKLEIPTKTKVETTEKTDDVENKEQQMKKVDPPVEAEKPEIISSKEKKVVLVAKKKENDDKHQTEEGIEKEDVEASEEILGEDQTNVSLNELEIPFYSF